MGSCYLRLTRTIPFLFLFIYLFLLFCLGASIKHWGANALGFFLDPSPQLPDTSASCADRVSALLLLLSLQLFCP